MTSTPPRRSRGDLGDRLHRRARALGDLDVSPKWSMVAVGEQDRVGSSEAATTVAAGLWVMTGREA
jgi:hypothetical protein